MAESKPKPENDNMDDGTSLEKEIELLNKDDPEYAAKRENLTEKLSLLRSELNKTHRKIRKQQAEMQAALKVLKKHADINPQNEELQHLLNAAKLDKSFLTRAVAEIVSIKGNLNDELKRLQSSKEFNQPLDMKIVTAVNVKPLPSEQTAKRREQTKEAVKTAGKKRPRDRKEIPLGRKILMLRQSMPERTTASRRGGRSNGRQG